MKKSTDFKNKVTASNHILGRVFLLVLSALIITLLYSDRFNSVNLYSVLASVLLVCALTYKSLILGVKAKSEKTSFVERLEFPLLLTLLFEIILEISGGIVFPLSYILLPVFIVYFGWAGALLSVSIITVVQVTKNPGPELYYQIGFLILSTSVLGYLLRGNKEHLRSYFFQKDINSQMTLPGAISGSIPKDDKDETDSVKRLKGEVRGSLELLRQLVPNHGVILYLKMEDGLYSLSDFISDDDDIVDRGQKLNFRGGYLGWVLKTRTQVLITSLKNIRKNLIYYKKNIPIKALLATPLFLIDDKERTETDDNIFGMLVVDSLDKDAFGEKEKMIVSLISDRLAEIVDKYQLSEKIKLSSQELNSFYDFTQKLSASRDIDLILDHILETMRRIFNADLLAVSLTHEDGDSSILKRVGGSVQEHVLDKGIPHRDTLIGLVADSGKYFHSDDLTSRSKFKSIFGKEIDFATATKKTRSLLIYPLGEKLDESENNEDNILGALIIGRSSRIPFNEGERSLARIICQEAFKSIQSAMDYTEVRELAIRDGLTGLYNHRHFQEMLEYTIVHSERFDGVASLIILDVDNLKTINDTYGHQAGDRAISTIGKVISETVRKVDVSARYGGDEFAIILPSTAKVGSIKVAEKIRNRLSNMPLKLKGAALDVTLSIGVATFPKDAGDRASLIEKADRALYISKSDGKNKITHSEDISVEELGS